MHGPDSFVAWAPWVGAGLALLFLWAAMRAARKQRLIDGLPTSKTTGVFIGQVELKGTAEIDEPLTSFLARIACVYYEWKVEEHWSRTVTETETDSDGKTHTRTRTESGSTTVAEGGGTRPFYLRDDCGVVLVQPRGAKIEPLTVFHRTCERDDPLYYGKGPAEGVADSDHRRTFREVAIPQAAPVYVVGKARERRDIVAPEIAEDREAPLFLISTRDERQVSRGYAITYWVCVLLGLVFCSVGIGFGLPMARGAEWINFALGAAAFGLCALLSWAWMAYNSLVDLRNRVASAWSQVDVQLKRRFDLIPRIEAVVKGLQQHERTVQESVAALRAQRAATPPGVTGPDFHALGPRVSALAESYPQLTAQPAFLDLQKQLVDTEQRIALARGYYNDIATHYNTRLEVVPDRFLAAATRMPPQPLMAANDFERAPVTVSFATADRPRFQRTPNVPTS